MMMCRIVCLFLVMAALGLGGCQATGVTEEREPPVLMTETAVTPTVDADITAAPSPGTQTPGMISLAEAETLAKADLAQKLNVESPSLTTVEATATTWPDAGLGCAARQGMHEPAPQPGYQIILAYEEQQYAYHFEATGRFILCVSPGKPLGPISNK